MGLRRRLTKVFKPEFKFDTGSKKLDFLGDWDADRRQGSEQEQKSIFLESLAKTEDLNQKDWMARVSSD